MNVAQLLEMVAVMARTNATRVSRQPPKDRR